MGTAFSNPITNQTVERYSSSFLRGSSTHVCGFRNGQEDAHTFMTNINEYGLHLVCVYDGHGGPQCSKWLEQNIPQFFESFEWVDKDGAYILDNREAYEEQLTELMYTIDTAFLRCATEMNLQDGSTATMMMLQPWDIHTNKAWKPDEGFVFTSDHKDKIALKCISINIGDSRSIIIREDKAFLPHSEGDYYRNVDNYNDDIGHAFVYCTEDHKPTDPEERVRINQSGGFVQNGRVNGTLALSRAFGDIEYKCHHHFPDYAKTPPPVRRVCVTPAFQEHFAYYGDIVFVACDGLFESQHFTPEEPLPNLIAQYKAKLLNNFPLPAVKQYCFDPAKIGRLAIQESIAHGSKDNHTAIVLSIGGLPDDIAGYIAAQKDANVMGEATEEDYQAQVDHIQSLPVSDLVPGPLYHVHTGDFNQCWSQDWSHANRAVTNEVTTAVKYLDQVASDMQANSSLKYFAQQPIQTGDTGLVPPLELDQTPIWIGVEESSHPLHAYQHLPPIVYFPKEQDRQSQQGSNPQLLQLLLGAAYGNNNGADFP